MCLVAAFAAQAGRASPPANSASAVVSRAVAIPARASPMVASNPRCARSSRARRRPARRAAAGSGPLDGGLALPITKATGPRGAGPGGQASTHWARGLRASEAQLAKPHRSWALSVGEAGSKKLQWSVFIGLLGPPALALHSKCASRALDDHGIILGFKLGLHPTRPLAFIFGSRMPPLLAGKQ
jgi:hypothetical protein